MAKTRKMTESVAIMRDPPAITEPASADAPIDDVRTLIQESRLDEAHQAVMTLLDQRIVAGDKALIGVALLAQFYQVVITGQPPLSYPGAEPLRPNDKLYQSFDAFIDLIRRQQSQIAELQAMVAELL
jgi:hypothetical protein